MVLLFCLATFSVAAGGAAAAGCMAGGCHQGLTRFKYMHGPVAAELAGANGCAMCHEPAGAKCSVGRGGRYRLKGKGLCVACHAKGAGSQHSAKEIESKCLKCHHPHGSNVSQYLLRAAGK